MHQLGPAIRVEIARIGPNLLLDCVGGAESAQGIEALRHVVGIILNLTKEGPHGDQLPFFGIGRERKANFLSHATAVSSGTKVSRIQVNHDSHIFSRQRTRPLPWTRHLGMELSQPATCPKEDMQVLSLDPRGQVGETMPLETPVYPFRCDPAG